MCFISCWVLVTYSNEKSTIYSSGSQGPPEPTRVPLPSMGYGDISLEADKSDRQRSNRNYDSNSAGGSSNFDLALQSVAFQEAKARGVLDSYGNVVGGSAGPRGPAPGPWSGPPPGYMGPGPWDQGPPGPWGYGPPPPGMGPRMGGPMPYGPPPHGYGPMGPNAPYGPPGSAPFPPYNRNRTGPPPAAPFPKQGDTTTVRPQTPQSRPPIVPTTAVKPKIPLPTQPGKCLCL